LLFVFDPASENKFKGKLVLYKKAMEAQIKFYQDKLDFEMDPSDLFEGLERGERLVPIDTRRTPGFETEHIPGAIHMPHREMTAESTKHLDRTLTYVCYCTGIGCNASTRGALKMTKLGFKVKELIGGIEWWKQDGYATEGENSVPGKKIVCAC
jgi:rhodanese-related sulfurtransferase